MAKIAELGNSMRKIKVKEIESIAENIQAN